MTYVTRDPFARTEIHKTHEIGVCAWCGAYDPKRARPLFAVVERKTYRFRVESDGGRKFEDRAVFCSLSCRKDYNA